VLTAIAKGLGPVATLAITVCARPGRTAIAADIRQPYRSKEACGALPRKERR